MNFSTYLNEVIQQNDILMGRTEIRSMFRTEFSNQEDIYLFRHNLDYMGQLPEAIVKTFDMKIFKESIIKWNKSGTQKTTERYYKSPDGKIGLYTFSGTGLSWLKHNMGILGTKNEDSKRDAINTLKAKGKIK